jgi:putative SOS response-associated peptidase YedK
MRGMRARLEIAADKPMLASSFRTRRCLILADGCYECRINFAIITLPTHDVVHPISLCQ